MDELLNALMMGIAALVLGSIARGIDRRIGVAGVLAFAAYLAMDDLATVIARLWPSMNVIASPWNWEGKIASLILAVAVIVFLRLRAADIGLCLPRHHLRSGITATALLIALSAMLGFVFQPGAPDAETLAFQMIAPGLVEEVVYRGIAPVLLLGAVASRLRLGEVPWAVVAATGAVFALWHGLGVSDGVPSFEWTSAALPAIGGMAYGWLRFRTGSLLLPVIAHAMGNALFYAHAFV